MRNIILFVVLQMLCIAGVAQVIITPAQYYVSIQSNHAEGDYSYLNNVTYNRQYTFKDDAGNATMFVNGYGPGTFSNNFFIVEANKPSTVSVAHNISYQEEYCESYFDYYYNTYNQYCWNETYGFSDMWAWDIPIKYPNFDTTIVSGDSYVTISVRQAGDNNYNLPSSDNISIKTESNITGFSWEYQVFDPNNANSTTWLAVPSGLIQPGGKEMIINGQNLFGYNWMTYLNRTVLFRMRNSSNGLTSNILIYTHRLSSPKIISTEAFQNPCYGFDTAYIKIKFDRALMTDEKINIFLQDTATHLDYSALNLSNSNLDAATNTYTWPRELIEGGYKVSLIGKYFDYATYTGAPSHFAFVKVTDPEPVRLYLSQLPVSCFGGNNGKMNIGAKGGVGNYKYELLQVDSSSVSVFTNFSNPVYNSTYGTMDNTVGGLQANMYKVRIRDGNNCMIRDSLGNEIYKTLSVKQPLEPLTASLLTVSPITASDQNNGAINIRISGGTPNVWVSEDPNFSKYRFEWRDSATNALITNFTLDTVGKFETALHNLSDGTYKFKAWDASYDNAQTYSQQGCFILLYIKVTRPAPLNVSVAVDSVIKCYGDAKGKLKAIPTGGIPLTVDSVKYNFTWYKNVSGSYVNQNVNDSVLNNIGAGEYKVEIRDKYNNLKSYIYNFVQPSVISAAATSTAASCYFTPDASMSINVSGGTAPYSYEWSTGHFTQTVPNVAGGSYVVVVKDANLCNISQQVIVTSPARINTVKNITPVGCNGSASGAISLNVSGGAGGYTYLWSNGSTGTSVNNLSSGSYWYKVTDSNGCYDTDTISFDMPEPYTINAGPDRKICTGQTINLKVENNTPWLALTSVWNGPQGTVNSDKISISTPGTYIATVSNASGCQKKDTVIVTAMNATVNTTFTVSTQAFAGENTTLVNISPATQDSAMWLLPSNTALTLLSQSKYFCELKFADTGRYVVGIRAYYSNGCIDEKYKDLNVVRKETFPNMGSQGESFMKQFGIFPNPNSGSFTLNMLFSNVTVARVRIINLLTNATISDKTLSGSASYTEAYNIGGYPAATYVVLIETPKGNFVHKLNKL